MTFAVWIIAAILAILTFGQAYYIARLRSDRHQRGLFGPWPVKRVPLEQFDSGFQGTEFGPPQSREVTFAARGTYRVPGSTDDFEGWILAALSKSATHMFEFGTATGRTAYLWARNSPDDACIVTITLAPDQIDSYRRGAGDRAHDGAVARRESVFTRFAYSGTDVESKVVQLFGDTKTLDESPYLSWADLIFIDASHAYSYVLTDSQKALRMIRPGGIILWHDYRGPYRAGGVFRALNELSKTMPLLHIAGTSLVGYRHV